MRWEELEQQPCSLARTLSVVGDRWTLLVLRETAAMGLLLAIHLGVVMALFLTLPYGKFVHGFLRLAALARYALEKKKGRAL